MHRAASRHRIQPGSGLRAAVLAPALAALAVLAPAPAGAQQAGAAPDASMVAMQADAPAAREVRRTPRLSLTLAPTLPGTAPGVQLGVRWSQPLAPGQALDFTAWRRVDEPPDALSLVRERDPSFGARVELKIAPARSRLVSDLRFIGLQLDSGGRIGLRRKNGGPMLYYRSQF